MQPTQDNSQFRIIADSCCDMTPQLKKRLGVISIPLTMRLDQKEFTDDDSLNLADFLSEMKACTEEVGSASPTPLHYQEAIERAQSAFVVTLSSELSGSYSSAVLGKTMAEENGKSNVHIFNSKSASAGEALVAIKIHELLQKGMNKEHIVQTIHSFIEGMKTYFVLENYDNLQKSGRLNKITGKLINALNIKLVMGSDGNGNIALHAKARGMKQTLEKLLLFIKDSGKKTAGENIVISHCNNIGLANQLAAAIEQHFDFREIFIVPTGGLSTLYADDKGIVMAF